MRFFEPTPTLTKSIIEYADGRLIVDLGCGIFADFCMDLLREGAKAVIGCDTFLDYLQVMPKARKFHSGDVSVHFFPGSLQDNAEMLSVIAKHPKGTLFLLCRPCHSADLIDVAIEISGESEILYIGLPKNVDDDLCGYQTEQLYFDGESRDSEIILKIIK